MRLLAGRGSRLGIGQVAVTQHLLSLLLNMRVDGVLSRGTGQLVQGPLGGGMQGQWQAQACAVVLTVLPHDRLLYICWLCC